MQQMVVSCRKKKRNKPLFFFFFAQHERTKEEKLLFFTSHILFFSLYIVQYSIVDVVPDFVSFLRLHASIHCSIFSIPNGRGKRKNGRTNECTQYARSLYHICVHVHVCIDVRALFLDEKESFVRMISKR
jgi:hypothetical protein